MSRILFTLEADVYELTPTVKQYFIEQTTTDTTLDVWFDGQRLYHKYRTTVDSDSNIETEWVDVVDVFQTLPQDAREQLNDAGVEPIICATNGIYPTDSTDLIDPRNNA